MPPTRDDGAETTGQAVTWSGLNKKYKEAGLCDRDAAQAAYGHQLGFARIHNPCTPCSKITLPSTIAEGTRKRGQDWLRGKFETPLAF